MMQIITKYNGLKFKFAKFSLDVKISFANAEGEQWHR